MQLRAYYISINCKEIKRERKKERKKERRKRKKEFFSNFRADLVLLFNQSVFVVWKKREGT